MKVAVLGVGLIGGSIGLAARRRAGAEVCGYDPDERVAQRALELGAIDSRAADVAGAVGGAEVAFAPNGKYMLLKGRFDWKALNDYATSVGGRCNNAVCNVIGSTPDRHISFFPLQKTLMALAVSPADGAADRMNSVDQRPDAEMPSAPIWLMIPPAVLASKNSLPSGTQMFADKLQRAQMVTISLNGDAKTPAAHMDVRCASVFDAVQIASDLTTVTNLLRRLIESENKTPNPADLSGFLTAGKFHNEGTKVVGEWPIEHALIENLLGQ